MLNDNDIKYTDDTQRIYLNYKAYKINEVKFMIYNESDNKKLSTLSNMKLKEKVYGSESDDSESDDSNFDV